MIHRNHNSQIEEEGLRIVKALQAGGFKAFWVGGSVRDMILRRTVDNLDIATSARPNQTLVVLKKLKLASKEVGKQYGTILAVTKYGPVEITTFRAEGEYVGRRRPKQVEYIDDYVVDSKRRDLTINALYYDPVKQELLDPQNGLADLERGLIKFVGDPKQRIDEDALRLIRAVRFAVQLSFKIEKNSFAAIKTRAKYIAGVPGERVKTELDKILLDRNRIDGMRLLDASSLLQFIMPEVTALKTIHHKSVKYHLEGSVFEHTLLVLQNVKAGSLPLAYAALYHDAGKAVTATPKLKDGRLVNSFPAHEYASAELFRNLAERLKMGRRDTQLILWITREHMKRIAFIKDMSFDKKIALVTHKDFPCLLEQWRADSISNLQYVDGNKAFGQPVAYKEGLKLLKKTQSKSKLIQQLTNGELILSITKSKPGPQIKKLKLLITENILKNKIKNLSSLKKFLTNYTKST